MKSNQATTLFERFLESLADSSRAMPMRVDGKLPVAYAARIGKDGASPSQFKLNEGDFSLTEFGNKYRPKNVESGSPGTFLSGEGDYDCDQAIFPTTSSFIIQGMMP